MQKPGDLPERRLQLSNASRKGVQAAVGNLFLEKIPSPACRIRVAERVTGFCLFSTGKRGFRAKLTTVRKADGREEPSDLSLGMGRY